MTWSIIDIVLEYRKKELVRLTLTDPLKGKPGEVKSLVSSSYKPNMR
ncbi:hypothetical protein ACLB1R_26220 [Escherichia coli]